VSEGIRQPLGFNFVSCCCDELVPKAGDSLGAQRKANVRRWKPLPSNEEHEDGYITEERKRWIRNNKEHDRREKGCKTEIRKGEQLQKVVNKETRSVATK
jgi:hypothetical protein